MLVCIQLGGVEAQLAVVGLHPGEGHQVRGGGGNSIFVFVVVLLSSTCLLCSSGEPQEASAMLLLPNPESTSEMLLQSVLTWPMKDKFWEPGITL